jgi:hypothetical protein
VKDGVPSAFRMRLEDIREKIREGRGTGTYIPEPVGDTEIDFTHGTRIILTEIRRRQTIRTTAALRKRVARCFAIVGPAFDFRVFIDDQEVVPANRGYYDKLQYLWTYGTDRVSRLCTNLEKHEDRAAAADRAAIPVRGWLGTVKESGQLKDNDGDNLNRIAIFVRGKMAQEDILDDFSEPGVYATYLIGELRVDALDTYDGLDTEADDDAATSSRQRIVEDDRRYQDLRRFLGDELKYIQQRWSELRSEAGAKQARRDNQSHRGLCPARCLVAGRVLRAHGTEVPRQRGSRCSKNGAHPRTRMDSLVVWTREVKDEKALGEKVRGILHARGQLPPIDLSALVIVPATFATHQYYASADAPGGRAAKTGCRGGASVPEGKRIRAWDDGAVWGATRNPLGSRGPLIRHASAHRACWPSHPTSCSMPYDPPRPVAPSARSLARADSGPARSPG